MYRCLRSILFIATVFLLKSCSSDDSVNGALNPAANASKVSFSISSASPENGVKSLASAEYVISGFSLSGEGGLNDSSLTVIPVSDDIFSPMQISSNTHYSGNSYSNGGNYYERIDWVVGDSITIFSDKASTASGSNFSNYGIKEVKPSTTYTSSAVIESPESSSLRWGADGVHNFIAVYPGSKNITSSMTTSFVSNSSYGVSNSSTKDAVMPSHQYARCSQAGGMVYEPDMNYAYMGAAVSVQDAGGNVSLKFVPLFNAYEFSLVKDGSAEMKLKKAVLSIKKNGGKYLSGSKYLFYVQSSASDISAGRLTSAGLDDSYSGADASNFSESVELSFRNSNGADLNSVTLSATEPLCFTMLSAPRQITAADELTITLDMIIGGEPATRILKLKKSGKFLELPASGKLKITNMSVPQTVEVPSRYTEHPFSVSASDKVYFSPGNLQAMPNAPGSAAAWRFAPHQYDVIGSGFNYTSGFTSSNKDYMDLFTWSVEATFGTGVRWGICTEYNANVWNDFIDGAYLEWGTNPLLRSTLGTDWFTPTESHWRYVVTGRVNCANLRSLGTVCGVRGLILLPDDWVLPQGRTFSPSQTSYTTNVYDASSWASMEANGAVFLPVAGCRENASVNVSMNNNYNSYYYWSSSLESAGSFMVRVISTHSAHYTSSSQVTSMNWSVVKANAHPVRLVRFVPVLPTDLSLQDIHGNPSAMTTANCYVVSKSGEYILPCVYGNAIKNGATNRNAYHSTVSGNANVLTNFKDHNGNDIYTGNDSADPWIESKYVISSASIVWQDCENMIVDVATTDVEVNGVSRKYVTFKVPDSPLRKGNAIIAVKDASGIIMWSWHIWVTDINLTPIEVEGRFNKKYYFLPVDIGWIDEGNGYATYYQWGRKDPMLPYSGDYNAPHQDHAHYPPGTFRSDDLGQDITLYIRNPHIFNRDYRMDNKYYNLWSANNTLAGITDNATVKTVYDPSPSGYCLPPSNAWSGHMTYNSSNQSVSNTKGWASGDNEGWVFYNGLDNSGTQNVYYPVLGYRNYYSGEVLGVQYDSQDEVGYSVYTASAIPSSASAFYDFSYYTYGSSDYINVWYNRDVKGYGVTVRPVRELFNWVDTGLIPGDSDYGCLIVGCYPTTFSSSAASGTLKIASDISAVYHRSDNTYTFSHSRDVAWTIDFSTDGVNFTSTAPSWIHFSSLGGSGGSSSINGGYIWNTDAFKNYIKNYSSFLDVSFTVDAISSGSRTVYVRIKQGETSNINIITITQGASYTTGGTTDMNYNIGIGNRISGGFGNLAFGRNNVINASNAIAMN